MTTTLRTAALLCAVAALAACPKDESCPAGTARCGDACVDPLSDTANCGACGARCAAGQPCCAGACVDTASDPAHCGGCGQVCFVGAPCASGVCGSCPPARPDPCPQTGPPGTCVNLATGDGGYCGVCSLSCAGTGVSDAQATCTAGTCVCSGGATDCGANPRCVNLEVDRSNCGGCGIPCTGANRTCAGGACVCVTGTTDCGGACVRLDRDPANCGGCGTRCATGATCASGQCTCPAGQTVCGPAPGRCVDLATDAGNCGGCGHACAAGTSCTAGACGGCPVACGGTCCAGTACCGAQCQTGHANGLGQLYFDCNALGTYTHAAALSAADAWSAGITYDGTTACGSGCVGRQTAAACAVWCWAGPLQGQVALGSGLVCQCPGTTGATTSAWN